MHEVDEDIDDQLEDMICDVGELSFMKAHIYDTLCSDKGVPLYKGCTSFTRLYVLLKLFKLKAKRGWLNKSFMELLGLLKQMLLEDKKLLDYCYEAKKILCLIDLEYIKVHVCPNDLILYMK